MSYYVDFISKCLDALLQDFENKIWAEREIKKNGIEFETKWGKGLGIESINDSVIKLAQIMGYVIVVRRDPRKGYVRIKTKPNKNDGDKGVDLTLACEKLKKMDPQCHLVSACFQKNAFKRNSQKSEDETDKITFECYNRGVKNHLRWIVFFAKYRDRIIPKEFTYEDEEIMVFPDIHPLKPVHLLIVPKKHVEDFLEFNDLELFKKSKDVIDKMIKEQKLETVKDTGFPSTEGERS